MYKEIEDGQTRTMFRKELFLRNFHKYGGVIKRVTQASGIQRDTYYKWLKVDPEFKTRIRSIC